MYAIYMFTLMGEATILSIRYVVGSALFFIYIICTSLIVAYKNYELFRFYIGYCPYFFIYITFVCYQIELRSRISFLQHKKISSLLNEQRAIFNHMPDGIIMHEIQKSAKSNQN